MKSYFSKSVINGVLKMVQHITYSNGDQVVRVLDANGIPESVYTVKKGKK